MSPRLKRKILCATFPSRLFIRYLLLSNLVFFCSFVHLDMKVYATVVAFYLPLIVIIILNTQIYIIARGIINREKKSPSVSRHFLVVNPSQIGAKTINTCTVKLVKGQDGGGAAGDQSTEDFTTVTSTPGLSEYEKG